MSTATKTQNPKVKVICASCSKPFYTRVPTKTTCPSCTDNPFASVEFAPLSVDNTVRDATPVQSTEPEDMKKLKGGLGSTEIAPEAAQNPKPVKKSTEEVQAILNELIWTKGNNIRDWSDYTQILASVGLERHDVTDEIYTNAVHASVERALQETSARQTKDGYKLEELAKGTHFRCNRWVGTAIEINTSECIVEVREGAKGKTERQRWSPATPVQVLTEAEFNATNSVSEAENNGTLTHVSTGETSAVDNKPRTPRTRVLSGEKKFLVNWGPREGGEARKVMEFMLGTKRTLQEMMATFSLTEKRVMAHIRFWGDKGANITKLEDGYILNN